MPEKKTESQIRRKPEPHAEDRSIFFAQGPSPGNECRENPQRGAAEIRV